MGLPNWTPLRLVVRALADWVSDPFSFLGYDVSAQGSGNSARISSRERIAAAFNNFAHAWP